MQKSIINAFILASTLSIVTVCQAKVYTCPVLHPNELYYYFDWIDEQGNKIEHGEWNRDYWRVWINGDSYFTPKTTSVTTAPLAAHYFATTNTWYLKCVSADLSVGPRNNVWAYSHCEMTKDRSGFECK